MAVGMMTTLLHLHVTHTFLLISRQVGSCILLRLGLRLRLLLRDLLCRARLGLLAGVTATHPGIMGAPCCLPRPWPGVPSLQSNEHHSTVNETVGKVLAQLAYKSVAAGSFVHVAPNESVLRLQMCKLDGLLP